MRVQLVMSHTNLDLFPDEQFVKWEKYQQVVGDKRILVDIERVGISAKLYQDKGDHYKLIPCFQTDGRDHWRFLLNPEDLTLFNQTGILKRYYVNPSRDKEGNFIDVEWRPPIFFNYHISKVKHLQVFPLIFSNY